YPAVILGLDPRICGLGKLCARDGPQTAFNSLAGRT
ncbi:MAG: hypothetical protein RJB12_1365, partial [Pseudomonadota bacterium]